MRTKISSVLFLILGIGLSGVFAQTPGQSAKTISKGVVNGAAVSLPKPLYPPAAKAVKASGTVSVQVTIDEEGNVISAAAVNGHPLLQAAAVEAARQAKFKPTLLQGQAVKVTGVIVYNFVADNSPAVVGKPSWYRAGHQLASLERMPLKYFYPAELGRMLQPDWTVEREQLRRLEEIKIAEQNAPETEKLNEERTVILSGKASAEQTAIVQNLASALQSRLANNEVDLWDFNLGLTVNKTLSQTRDAVALREGAEKLRNHLQSAPNGTPPELIAEVEKLLTILERKTYEPGAQSEIGAILTNMNRIQATKK